MKTDIIIQEILSKFQKRKINFDVYIIANAQEKTSLEYNHKVAKSDESEFFSRKEFAEIASAIFDVFGYVKVFYSEEEFIKYVIYKDIKKNECLIINYSRNGNFEGKKSLIPAFCDLYQLRYTGCNAFVISLIRNKAIFTDLLLQHGVTTPPTKIYSRSEMDYESLSSTWMGKKIIIKNVYDSASIGLSDSNVFLFNKNNFDNYLRSNKQDLRNFIIQEFIDGAEYEVLVLQHQEQYHAMTPVQIVFRGGSKYINSEISNNYDYGFSITNQDTELLQKMATTAAQFLNIKDYARFDFRVKNGIPYLIDIAGTPYTIRHSSIAFLFKHYDFNYRDIYKVIVECTLSNYDLS